MCLQFCVAAIKAAIDLVVLHDANFYLLSRKFLFYGATKSNAANWTDVWTDVWNEKRNHRFEHCGSLAPPSFTKFSQRDYASYLPPEHAQIICGYWLLVIGVCASLVAFSENHARDPSSLGVLLRGLSNLVIVLASVPTKWPAVFTTESELGSRVIFAEGD